MNKLWFQLTHLFSKGKIVIYPSEDGYSSVINTGGTPPDMMMVYLASALKDSCQRTMERHTVCRSEGCPLWDLANEIQSSMDEAFNKYKSNKHE